MYILRSAKRSRLQSSSTDELVEKIVKAAEEFRDKSRQVLIWQMQEKYRTRMKSIQDTMKITNAMYMISSSKMQKSQEDPGRTRNHISIHMQSCHCQDPPSYAGHPASFLQ